jgi:hypothetical protein
MVDPTGHRFKKSQQPIINPHKKAARRLTTGQLTEPEIT